MIEEQKEKKEFMEMIMRNRNWNIESLKQKWKKSEDQSDEYFKYFVHSFI